MSRKLSLLFLGLAISIISACSSITAPNREECDVVCEEPPPSDSGDVPCSVTAGTQTHC